MFNQTTISTYCEALLHARETSDLIAHNCLSLMDIARVDHSQTEWYVSDDMASGFGVTYTGELVGVFSLVRGRGALLVQTAIRRGAERLDCFDGFLVSLYESNGFEETHREPNWTAGQPDVVFMALADTLPVPYSITEV